MTKYKLKLSKNADQDLQNLYIEGFQQWGETQADKYFQEIIEHFDLLSASPLLFASVDHIRNGYRRSICGSHSIYYRIQNDTVEVMGILKRQNPVDHLP